MSRPVIGVPTQNLQSLGGSLRRYSAVVGDEPAIHPRAHRVGALPWMIPLVGDEADTMRGIYDELDGVFLPGGADIDPANYGEERHPSATRAIPRATKWS